MTKGEATQVKVHYKGQEDDFLVFVESSEIYKKWLEDRSIPLTEVVSAFKIFVTRKHGAQGNYDGASNATLDNEFGTHIDTECVTKILEKGTVQETSMPGRTGPKNDAQGSMVAH